MPCFSLGYRFENTQVEATLNHPFPAQVLPPPAAIASDPHRATLEASFPGDALDDVRYVALPVAPPAVDESARGDLDVLRADACFSLLEEALKRHDALKAKQTPEPEPFTMPRLVPTSPAKMMPFPTTPGGGAPPDDLDVDDDDDDDDEPDTDDEPGSPSDHGRKHAFTPVDPAPETAADPPSEAEAPRGEPSDASEPGDASEPAPEPAAAAAAAPHGAEEEEEEEEPPPPPSLASS